MRVLLYLILVTALLSSDAAAGGARSPCDLATKTDVRQVLGGSPVAPDPATIGEETAPSCLWTTGEGGTRVKLEIWSPDELQVLGLASARAYFVKRQREALAHGGIRLRIHGLAIFRTRFRTGGDPNAGGEIGVLKRGRSLIFEFEHVSPARAERFARTVARRY